MLIARRRPDEVPEAERIGSLNFFHRHASLWRASCAGNSRTGKLVLLGDRHQTGRRESSEVVVFRRPGVSVVIEIVAR